MQEQRSEQTVTLIYHDFRGMAQIIRYVLYYLNIPFQELLLKQGQILQSLNIIQQKKMTDSIELPCLIDGDKIIQQCFTIIWNLCLKVGREDLLGYDPKQRAIIRQIYYNFTLNKKKEIMMLFKFGQLAVQNPAKKEEIRVATMKQSHEQSGSLIPMAKIILKNPSRRYILGHITILDFLFFEQSFYHFNLFKSLDDSTYPIDEKTNFVSKIGVKDESLSYLRVMKSFMQFFQAQPFYAKNKERLESYGLFCPIIKNTTKQGFQMVWLGPRHFLK